MSNCGKLCRRKYPRSAVTNLGLANLLGQVNVSERTCAVCQVSIGHLPSRSRYCTDGLSSKLAKRLSVRVGAVLSVE